MDLQKYSELFLLEAREHIATMNAALIALERDRSNEAITSLFRAAHNIKGMAAAMQYTTISDLAHTLESLLDTARTGEREVTPPFVEHLYRETDTLSKAIEAIAEHNIAGHQGDDTAAQLDEESGSRERGRHRREVTSRHVRVDAARLDALMNLTGELAIARGRLERVARGTQETELSDVVAQMSRLVTELRDQVMLTRMVPVGQVFERLPPLVRETARGLKKEINFTIDGADIELDRSMLDAIGDPVLHLLRNAVDHGIEDAAERAAVGKPLRGRLTLTAQRESGCILLRVADDGRGIDRRTVLDRAQTAGMVEDATAELNDADLLNVLVRPGFSTSDQVTGVSGRGVGLDVVDSAVRALGGMLELRSISGCGTAITLRLPLTVVIVHALLARIGDEIFAVPMTHVVEAVELDPISMHVINGRLEAEVHGERLQVSRLREALGFPEQDLPFPKAVIVDGGGFNAALVVDEFVGQQDIVVKPFTVPYGSPQIFSGATILNDGVPALILDVNSLLKGSARG